MTIYFFFEGLEASEAFPGWHVVKELLHAVWQQAPIEGGLLHLASCWVARCPAVPPVHWNPIQQRTKTPLGLWQIRRLWMDMNCNISAGTSHSTVSPAVHSSCIRPIKAAFTLIFRTTFNLYSTDLKGHSEGSLNLTVTRLHRCPYIFSHLHLFVHVTESPVLCLWSIWFLRLSPLLFPSRVHKKETNITSHNRSPCCLIRDVQIVILQLFIVYCPKGEIGVAASGPHVYKRST